MTAPLHDGQWYRVAGLKPALRGHVEVTRQLLRGEASYVLRDRLTGRNWRVTERVERLLSMMDGRTDLDTIWNRCEQAGLQLPTQAEVLRLLSQLHLAEMLQIDTVGAAEVQTQRATERSSRQWRSRLMNPLSIRTRLWDPDRFLTRSLPWANRLVAPPMLALWSLLAAWAVWVLVQRWQDIGTHLGDLQRAPRSWFAIAAVYVVVKAVHELAHAFAVKRRGGEVHEMGLLWMLLIPVPYVDASAAHGMADKWSRIKVSAAGIVAELVIASVALLVWAFAEPGWWRSLAYLTFLTAGFSTLVINANPLFKYDGYFVLSDWLEIPNLAQRANAQVARFSKRWLWRLPVSPASPLPRGEALWLYVYAPLSFFYRLVVFAAIATWLATSSKMLAVAVLLYSIGTIVVLPAARGLIRIWQEAAQQAALTRTMGFGALASAVLIVVMALPLPQYTTVRGVMWLPQQGEVRAESEGQLQRWLIEPGSPVEVGTALAELENPELQTLLLKAQANHRAAQSRVLEARAKNSVEIGSLLAQLQQSAAELTHAERQADERIIHSSVAGQFVVARPDDQLGRYIRQGQTLGYVVPPGKGTVLTVVDQDQIGLLKQRLLKAEVRFFNELGTTHLAEVSRLTPGGTHQLPSAALGVPAGGSIAVDLEDPEGRKTLDQVFQVELSLDQNFEQLGGRAWVRFDHGREALAGRMARRVQQLFFRGLYG